ncbi:DUF4129 domain-containing protein [Microbacterium aoyamense]|uniref:DUF4129 domain-containing protein n=1 Tax=Microbacterium aoyamense TaxID=344166 RepID=A0ABP5AZR7_9MICO|nr:DUF4129 domain-containing protein [Microbacterium aoyamense]
MGVIPLAATPLIPDGDDARRWAEQELSDPAYRITEPTFFDQAARAVWDFVRGLFGAEVSQDWGTLLAIVGAIAVVVLIVVAFLIWGRPRSTRRAPAPHAALFGDADERTAEELRRAAASHADRGEWADAVVLRFRALARGLAERGIVDTPPGATVHAFARAAAGAFPPHTDDLESAAQAFDDVRYLRRPGTAALYARVASVDDAIAADRPLVTEGVPA